MASINYAYKEIISKIVYYGPGLSGKTTNLQYVFKKVPAETRGELISLATDADRTLYFDFLPLNVGTIKGFATKFQLYTVPGQVYYNATRKLVLRGVDGIVFVADSQAEKLDENMESFQNLQDNLAEYGYDIDSIPTVIQYNKRDLPSAMEISELEKALNKKGFPHFEAVAPSGEGVFKTLKMISKMVLEEIRKNKMGAPNAVKSQQPKPEPVGVSVSGSGSTEKTAAGDKSEKPQSSAVQGEAQAISEKTPETDTVSPATEEKSETEQKREIPGIVEDSDTLANVVVSDSQNLPDEEEEDTEDGDLEDTTERAILKEETAVDEKAEEEPESSKEADYREQEDSSKESEVVREPLYERSSEDQNFDEEATQISDLNLKNPLPLGKPQMAESRKVKNKRKKFGLLGMFKKSNK
ncbi:MAG: GTPase domain-containing protein [Candidatus Zixiibacteriota bacterium]|nr:MAG: GTPase domain-containing protein [candidate division Zixibacteria bacterium]